MKKLKEQLFKYWIKIYCYNNALIRPVKHRFNGMAGNLILLIFSPYIILNWLFSVIYERVIGFGLMRKKMDQDRQKSFKYELAVVSISKNEGPFIKEWIEFHRLVGVQKFYFYDNASEDNTAEILKPYVDEGIVEYTLLPGIGMQIPAYNDAIKRHKDECRWMAFIDMDEYLMPSHSDETLPQAVERVVYGAGGGAAGVAVNWATFGTSGHKTRQKGLVTETFKMRAENDYWTNYHVKCVCNPRLVTDYISPHYPLLRRGAYIISEDAGARQWGWFSHNVVYKNLRINHYYTKSEEEYAAKRARGLGDRAGIYADDQFVRYNKNDVRDDVMGAYVDSLRAAMGRE